MYKTSRGDGAGGGGCAPSRSKRGNSACGAVPQLNTLFHSAINNYFI